MQIKDIHRIEVDTEDGAFQFEVSDQDNRLVLARTDDEREEVCAITLDDPGEFAAFFEGLRRVFRAHPRLREQAAEKDRAAASPRAIEASARRNNGGNGRDDRFDQEQIERARKSYPNAFKSWSKDEERKLVQAYESGTSVEQLAEAHDRSQRAIKMRLEKLGAL